MRKINFVYLKNISYRNAALLRGKNPQKLIDGSQGQWVYSTDGAAVTQCAGSGGWGDKTGLYFIDMNPDTKLTENARCITARQDSGISNHKGEHSGVFVEEPRAVINPEKEKRVRMADG